MCGIFGVVLGTGTIAVDVDRAVATLRHRGPDDARSHRDDAVVLGHTRLSILDLSENGRQPMSAAGGDVVIVYNGEIYNHEELRDELEHFGHVFRSRTDTEVILEGYLAWGPRIVERLDGMFAFAIWDRRTRTLVMARDRAGEKPLFYGRLGDTLWFASEARALFEAGFPCDPDLSALPTLLTFGCARAPRSMYRRVLQLPPAMTLTYRADSGPVLRRYWQPPFDRRPFSASEDEAAEQVRILLEGSVKRRVLCSDVPVGAFLSGGVDSTIIVALMAKHAQGRLKTFSVGFKGDARFDETHYARIAAQASGTDHHEIIVDANDVSFLERLVEVHDGPFGDSSAIPTSIVAGFARSQGVTVALSGEGGDEIFCGYLRFLTVEAAEFVPPSLRALGAAISRSIPPPDDHFSVRARTQKFLRKAELDLVDRMLSWTSFFGFELPELLTPEVLAAVDPDEPRAASHTLGQRYQAGSTLSRLLAYNFETYLPDDLLVKADRSSMLHSLELRCPFLDHQLVEYVARLPDSHKRRGTETKRVLRRAFDDILPEAIKRRGKMGFGIPLGSWLRTGLRPYLMDHLGDGARMWDYVNQAYVRRLLDEHMSNRDDHGHLLWLLLTFELWLRRLRAPLRIAA